MTDHDAIESLLGAYALDAVDPDEVAIVERHLRECPRCRAEVAADREVAALLANAGAAAPDELWVRIAAGLRSDEHSPTVDMPPLSFGAVSDRRRRRRRLAYGAGGALAAAVALVIALLSTQVVHLDGQVQALQRNGLAPVVAAVLSEPHRTVQLTALNGTSTGSVAITAGDVAYWVGSNLRELPAGRTYQLWALESNEIVSLGLLGANPSAYSMFRLDPSMSALMVTAEPAGGTPTPTTQVLVRGAV